MLKQHKNLELKKHVGAIHSSNPLSLIQRKIANGLLFNAYDDLLTKDEHHISIKYLCDLIGYDSKDYKSIKHALMNLLSTVVEWNLIDKDSVAGESVWNASSIIADASIEGGTCSYSYSNRMKQLLHRPEMYGRLNMTVQAKFKSSYGLALYENCIRYQNIDQTPWFEFEVFRRLMGVEENKYLIFRDFKRRVLDKAVSEVNKYAPIEVKAEFRKDKRKVALIRFTIQKNFKSINSPKTRKFSVETVNKLEITFSLSEHQIIELEKKYEESYVIEKTSLIETSSNFKNGKIANREAYLMSALIGNFLSTSCTSNADRSKELNRQYEENKIRELRKEEDSLQKNYSLYVNDFIKNTMDNSDHSLTERILIEFEIRLESEGKGIFLPYYRRNGLNSSMVSSIFKDFITQQYPKLISKMLSFADYKNLQLDTKLITPIES